MTSAEKPIWWQVGLRAMRSAAARAFGIHSRTGEPAGRSMPRHGVVDADQSVGLYGLTYRKPPLAGELTIATQTDWRKGASP